MNRPWATTQDHVPKGRSEPCGLYLRLGRLTSTWPPLPNFRVAGDPPQFMIEPSRLQAGVYNPEGGGRTMFEVK
jgi:hypothetical protein